MHSSLVLLDRVMGMAEHELVLLELDDAEGLTESVQERERMVGEAWAGRADCDEVALLKRLIALRDFQSKLDSIATSRYEEIRDRLKERKQASRAIGGYGGARLKRSILPQVFVSSS